MRQDKDPDYRRLIQSARWLSLRRAKLSRQPLCERCQSEGRVTAATEVHHIRPVQDAVGLQAKARLAFDPLNLRSLCHQCHVKTHEELGRGGKAYAKRKRESEMRMFCEKYGGQSSDGSP